MPLKSRLLRGDPRLESCLINDAAHLTIGASGPPVGRIQKAVTILSDGVIEPQETTRQIYGASTARAVLGYKRDRNIVNRSYQSQADDIVGKMTIRSLDDEMVQAEGTVLPRRHCGDLVVGGGPVVAASVTPAPSTPPITTVAAVGYTLPTVLTIAWQISTLGEQRHGRRLADQVDAGNQLLNDLLITPVGGDLRWVKAFPYNVTMDPSAHVDVFALRKAAGKARPLAASELRIIVHPFEDRSPEFGITDWGEYEGVLYSPFVILNANKERGDKLTLLHEMIHATRLTVHDGVNEPNSFPDATSVFSQSGTRDHIRDAHVDRLRKMSWAGPWPY